MIEGLCAWAKNDVHCEKGKWNSPATWISKDFPPFSIFGWQIYEPTKIYNSINRAKIINFFYPETISVTQLFVNMHFAFLFSLFHISLFRASIILLMKVRNYLQISSLGVIIVNLFHFLSIANKSSQAGKLWRM